MSNLLKYLAQFIIILGVCHVSPTNAQDKPAQRGLCVIDNIKALESQKDPKCHATASRLEDFMYGTPLTEQARIRKFDLQKKLILFIWNQASNTMDTGKDSIDTDQLKRFSEEVMHFGRNVDGQWYVGKNDNQIIIDANDMRQYSSVAYALRAMLSVEQDFLFNPQWNLVPMNDKAIDAVKLMVDLATLATLKTADQNAREKGDFTIGPNAFEEAWNSVFENDNDRIYINSTYPSTQKSNTQLADYVTIKSIINQKIESYKIYNSISLPIFLRNIQVYFARHKWPNDTETSDQLKSYLIESLVYFCKELIVKADAVARTDDDRFLRAQHINSVIPMFLPFEINDFEDVIYFPNLEESIMIESYDLDAFRDSGIHWLILSYALQDIESMNVEEPDPYAAELIVETVAQMALLVLRFTGDISIQNGHELIQLSDMTGAFEYIQSLIYKSGQSEENSKEEESNIQTSLDVSESAQAKVFFDMTTNLKVNYYHKSSDWLSRMIRSYVVKKDENLVRMAIPPAFGGSGIAAEDLNNDGWQDIIMTGGMGVKIFINQNGKGFEDVSTHSGLDTWNPEINSFEEVRQIIVADFDNDGWQDVFLSLVNQNHKLFKNINGFNFKDVSDTAQLGGAGKVGGPATAFDYDNDGLLDIYVGYFGNYLEGEFPTLSRKNQNGDTNELFENKGNFLFEKVDHCASDDIDFGWTQALGHSDINRDGWQDIIVGNDFGVNAYYINQKNGQFKNATASLKTDKPSYTMNVGSTDLNGDRYPDFYISNIVVMEKDEKYVNPSGQTKMNFQLEKMENIRTVEANDLFVSRVDDQGRVSYVKSKDVGRGYSSTGWSWDADFFDYDNDGDEDLYCLNGMNDFRVYGAENPIYRSPDGDKSNVVYAQSNRERNNFFVNENGKLIDRASRLGADLLANSRSASYLDFDRDGDLDIVVNNYHDKTVFLENRTDNDNNWIGIKLKGNPEAGINADAIGCNIIVESKMDDYQQWREVKSTTGYLSVHPKMQHFGLGQIKEVDVTIEWYNGQVQKLNNLKANQEYIVDYLGDVKILPIE